MSAYSHAARDYLGERIPELIRAGDQPAQAVAIALAMDEARRAGLKLPRRANPLPIILAALGHAAAAHPVAGTALSHGVSLAPLRRRRRNKIGPEFEEFSPREAQLGALVSPTAAPVLERLAQSFAGGKAFTRDELAHELTGLHGARGFSLSPGSLATRAGLAISELEKKGLVTRYGRSLGPSGRPGPAQFALTRLGEERAQAQGALSASSEGEALAEQAIAAREAFLAAPRGPLSGPVYRPVLHVLETKGHKVPHPQRERMRKAGYRVPNPDADMRALERSAQLGDMNALEHLGYEMQRRKDPALADRVYRITRALMAALPYGDPRFTLLSDVEGASAFGRAGDWTGHVRQVTSAAPGTPGYFPKTRFNPLTGRETAKVLAFGLRELGIAQSPTISAPTRIQAAATAYEDGAVAQQFGPRRPELFRLAEQMKSDAMRALSAARASNPLQVLLLGNPGLPAQACPVARMPNPPPGTLGVEAVRRHAQMFHGAPVARWVRIQVPDGRPGITRKAFSGLGFSVNTAYEVPFDASNKFQPDDSGRPMIWDHFHKARRPLEAYDPIGHTSMKFLVPGSGPSDWWRDDKGPPGPWRN